MLPGLARDAVVISRAGTTAVDAEGDYNGAETAVASTRGAWGRASPREQQQAAQRGQTLDAVVALDRRVDVRLGDLVAVRGHSYVVVGLQDVRIHQRALLRMTA